MESPIELFSKAPPIARTIALVAFILSIVLYLDLLPLHQFTLSVPFLFQLPPQLWRLFTSMFITQWPFGIFFDTYFLYVYGAKLEIASPRFTQRADFVTYICFVSAVIVLLNLSITDGSILAFALALSFVTTAVRDSWDQPMTFFILKLPCQYLPYLLLFMTLIFASPHMAIIHGTGLVAAHLYDLFTGIYPQTGIKRNLITTPDWMKKVVGTQAVVERPYGVAMNANGSASGAKAAWGLDLSWKRFGEGRRLGGDVEGSGSGTRQRPKGWVLAAIGLSAFIVGCGFIGYFFAVYGPEDTWLADRLAKVGGSATGPESAE